MHGIMMVSMLAILLMSILATSIAEAETVLINDGASLGKYLCSPSGTISPNTNLILNKSLLMIDGGKFCLIENTTNITIAPLQELMKVGSGYVEVHCLPGSGGFGFFNVTNLNISSVMFRDCAGDIPAPAVRYVNGTDQNLLYDNVRTVFIFNHCYNITLWNLIPSKNASEFSMIGVNLCGHNSINTITSAAMPEMKTLLYYTDSAIVSSSSECDLHIEYDASVSPASFSIQQDYTSDSKTLISCINDWFTLAVTQQKFDVNVNNMNIRPTGFPRIQMIGLTVIFINSITNSQVVFQGLPYEYCLIEEDLSYSQNVPLNLNIIFQETDSFNTSVSGVKKSFMIMNTSFALYKTGTLNSVFNAWLYITQISRKTSHEVVMKNVSWCMKDFESNSRHSNNVGPYNTLFMADNDDSSSLGGSGLLHITMVNTHMHYYGLSPESQIAININENINITMSGNNYFAVNGGKVINVQSSNLTITGNFTASGAYADITSGGGIILDHLSTLFLKEPLEAYFYNNRAPQGSAIYVSPFTSDSLLVSMQILPNEIYSLENITEMKIALYFKNNTNNLNVPNSIHAPETTFLYLPILAKFLFAPLGWDYEHSQLAFTRVFDVVMKDMNEFDKHSSIFIGLCKRLHGQQWNCQYLDRLLYYSNSTYVTTFHTYPGEVAISISNTHGYSISVQQVSCSDDGLIINNLDSTLTIYNSTASVIFKNKENKIICSMISHNGVLPLDFYVYVNAFCPLGFQLSTEKGYCNCTQALHLHNYTCDIDTRVFTSPSSYWTGCEECSHNTSIILFTRNCPPNYCNTEFRKIILNESIADLSCLNNRTGILCGQCKENYSAVFGSDTCYSHCTDLYLLTLPMYALAGLILVVLLFTLRLTVATGTINGAIFYANILGLSMDKLTQGYNRPYLVFFRIVISLLNLDLGFPLCFYKGMTTTARVGFQFVFPVYLWSIVIGMIIISKYSVRVSNLISNSSVQVLATLLYLSYSKLLRAVIDIFSPSTLYSVYDNNNVSEKTVWYFTGEDYGHGLHGFYLFLATTFIILFLLPYTILVTFSHCFMRFKLVNRFKPFIDAYVGPFKDKWRFWFGLRLWITITLFTVNGILQGTNTKTTLTVHLIILMAFILLQAFCRPFKCLMVGFMDTAFMVDYWLIVGFYCIFGLSSTSLGAYVFLVSAAILATFLILLYHCGHRCSKSRKHRSFYRITRKYSKGYELIEDVSKTEADEDTYKKLFDAAKEREEQIIDTY